VGVVSLIHARDRWALTSPAFLLRTKGDMPRDTSTEEQEYPLEGPSTTVLPGAGVTRPLASSPAGVEARSTAWGKRTVVKLSGPTTTAPAATDWSAFAKVAWPGGWHVTWAGDAPFSTRVSAGPTGSQRLAGRTGLGISP
jgi:hypothetical protein